MKKLLLHTLVCWLSIAGVQAQNWIYSDTVVSGNNVINVYLWVAPDAENLKGLILAPEISATIPFVTDPAIRAMAQANQLGIVYFRPAGFAQFDTTQGDHLLLERALAKLAAGSLFPEVEHAPWIAFGHSTTGYFAKNLAYWKPERMIAVVYHKSGAIGPPAWSRHATLPSIPFLAISGQYEEFGPRPSGAPQPGDSPEMQWWAVRDSLLKLRRQGALTSMLVDPGAGHWPWSPSHASYVAQFMAKAVQARVPAQKYAHTAPITLNTIAENSGWLTDTTVKTQAQKAAYLAYTGEASNAFWHLDSEMAQAWVDFHHDKLTRRKQEIVFNSGTLNAGRYKLADQTLGTGNDVFGVAATANSGLPVKYRWLMGPLTHVADEQFRKDPCRSNSASERIYILAYQEGNAEYNYAERPAEIILKDKTTGADQTVRIDAIPDKNYNSAPFKINADATSGLAVEKCIITGPAVLKGDSVYVTGIPRGAAKVVIRAAQAGDANFKTARAEQSFMIYGPALTDIAQNLIKSPAVTIYPNPAREIVTVKGITNVASISIYDLMGKKLAVAVEPQPSVNGALLSIGHLPKGVYSIAVRNGEGRSVYKLLKE